MGFEVLVPLNLATGVWCVETVNSHSKDTSTQQGECAL